MKREQYYKYRRVLRIIQNGDSDEWGCIGVREFCERKFAKKTTPKEREFLIKSLSTYFYNPNLRQRLYEYKAMLHGSMPAIARIESAINHAAEMLKKDLEKQIYG